ncbi:N-acetyltransferase family protein [Vibrio breoganii]
MRLFKRRLKDIEIRLAEREDLEDICAVYTEVYSEPPRSEKIYAAVISDRLQKYWDNNTIIVALHKDLIVGFIVAQPHRMDKYERKVRGIFDELDVSIGANPMYVDAAAVANGFRDKGVYTQMHDFMTEYMRSLEVSALVTRCRVDITAEVRALKKFGYSELAGGTFAVNGVLSEKRLYVKYL